MSRDRPAAIGTVVYAVVAAAVGIGLLLVALGSWRAGIRLCGAALGVAGTARLVVPERMTGLLRVRRRTSDALLMLGMGVALFVLAVIVPEPGPPA